MISALSSRPSEGYWVARESAGALTLLELADRRDCASCFMEKNHVE